MGKWAVRHQNAAHADQLGLLQSYRVSCWLLNQLNTVEDWGCGTGFARQFFRQEQYLGIDGSASRWCDVVENVAERKSSPQGILLRHVLEHNTQWRDVLASALACATHRIVVVVFTKLVTTTRYENDADGIPCISFAPEEIEAHFGELAWARATIGTDTLWVIDKPVKSS